jgi:hypothetical protein
MVSTLAKHQNTSLAQPCYCKTGKRAYKLSLESKPENSYKLTGLQGIAVRSYSSKEKSPALAAIMSAILPGAGKAYCGYWGDG